MNYQEQYQEWLTNPYFDEETKQELKALGFKKFCTFDKMQPIYHQL